MRMRSCCGTDEGGALLVRSKRTHRMINSWRDESVSEKILIVDDDPDVLASLLFQLGGRYEEELIRP